MKGQPGDAAWLDDQESDGLPSAPPQADTAGSEDAPSAPPAPEQQQQQQQQQRQQQQQQWQGQQEAGARSNDSHYPAMLPVSSGSPFGTPAPAPATPSAAVSSPFARPQLQYQGQASSSDTTIDMPPPDFYSRPYKESYDNGHAASSSPYADGAAAGYSGYGYGAFTPSEYVNDNAAPLLGPSSYDQNDLLYANRQVRHGFLRKVLGLLTVQLLLTAAIGGAIAFNKTAHDYMYTNLWVLWLATVLSFTVLIVLTCSEDARRRHPTNLLLLLVFTAAEGVLVGTISASFDTKVVLLAFVVTAVVTLALVLYALQTSVDFTVTGGILYSALLILLAVSLANLFLNLRTVDLLISGCGALLFSAYLVFDVQLVASGEHSFQIGADEYIFAALNVYIDIIQLFVELLRITQQLSDE